jgi:hypothetical protein
VVIEQLLPTNHHPVLPRWPHPWSLRVRDECRTIPAFFDPVCAFW